MWTIALSLLTKNWKLVVVALAVGALYFYWSGRTETIKEQAQEITRLKTENGNLKTSINTQNDAVTKLEEEKKVKDAKLRAAEENSKQIRKAADAEVLRILQGIKPETCNAAIQYLIDAVKAGELKL